MSAKVQIFNCGEQGAKLEAFEKSIENGSVGNISEDEKRRQKELEISGRIAQETFNDFNEEFYNNVTQFDLLINNTNNSNEILTITEVVLANYEEIVKSQ